MAENLLVSWNRFYNEWEILTCLWRFYAPTNSDKLSDSFKLLSRISPQIDFGRLNIIMTQPQRNLPDIPRGLKHQHGTGVPQDMW